MQRAAAGMLLCVLFSATLGHLEAADLPDADAAAVFDDLANAAGDSRTAPVLRVLAGSTGSWRIAWFDPAPGKRAIYIERETIDVCRAGALAAKQRDCLALVLGHELAASLSRPVQAPRNLLDQPDQPMRVARGSRSRLRRTRWAVITRHRRAMMRSQSRGSTERHLSALSGGFRYSRLSQPRRAKERIGRCPGKAREYGALFRRRFHSLFHEALSRGGAMFRPGKPGIPQPRNS